MGDPVTMAMIGAGTGALTSDDPLQGALMGGALGGLGGGLGNLAQGNAFMGMGNTALNTAGTIGQNAVTAGLNPAAITGQAATPGMDAMMMEAAKNSSPVMGGAPPVNVGSSGGLQSAAQLDRTIAGMNAPRGMSATTDGNAAQMQSPIPQGTQNQVAQMAGQRAANPGVMDRMQNAGLNMRDKMADKGFRGKMAAMNALKPKAPQAATPRPRMPTGQKPRSNVEIAGPRMRPRGARNMPRLARR